MRATEQYEEHVVFTKTTSISCDFCNEAADELTEPGEPILWENLSETICLCSTWDGKLNTEVTEEELIICPSCFAKLLALRGRPLPISEEPDETSNLDIVEEENSLLEEEEEEEEDLDD